MLGCEQGRVVDFLPSRSSIEPRCMDGADERVGRRRGAGLGIYFRVQSCSYPAAFLRV